LAPPYKRATAADNGGWVQESLHRQMFHEAFERDEAQVAECDARVRIRSADGKSLQARLVATDRALHARVTLGPGIHQTLRLHYDQVKYVEVSRPEGADVEVVSFNPDRATDEIWHVRIDQAHVASGFAATLVHLVSHWAAARTAAAQVAEAVQAGRRSNDQTWTVAAARANAREVEVA
jgi:hypothetical protein